MALPKFQRAYVWNRDQVKTLFDSLYRRHPIGGLLEGIKSGVLSYDFSDPDSDEQKAVFDLAWPEGIQAQLRQPVAVLLNEPAEVIATASQAGYQCFTDIPSFKQYIVLNTTE